MITQRILLFFERQEYLLVFFACFFLLSLLQLHSSFPDPDSFYHARIAVEMLGGPVVSFSALPFTVLADIFIDHHFLYHVFLLPFVSVFDPLVGLKIATVLSAAGFLTFFTWLLRVYARCNRGLALGFLFFLILNTVFLFRINLAKIPAVSLLVYFAGVYAIMREKYAALFGLSFLYVWLYAGWPLMPLSVCIAWVVRAAYCALSGKAAPGSALRIVKLLFSWPHLKLPLTAISGALAGLIINPYFPTNIVFTWIQTFKIAVLNILTDVPVGGEWYPSGLSIIPVHGPTLILLVCAFLAILLPSFFSSIFQVKQTQRTWHHWFLFALTGIFFVFTLKSRRHGEYFAPLATLFAAAVLAPLFSRQTVRNLLRTICSALRSGRTLRGAVTLYFIIAAPLIIGVNFFHVIQSFRDGFQFTRYARGSTWIADHIPEGETIYHQRWDDFPLFYYHAPRYRYISGLDPRFFFERDPIRAKAYNMLSEGGDLAQTYGYRALCAAADSERRAIECTPKKEKEEMERTISSFHPSAVLFTNRNDMPLDKKFRGAPGFEEAYRDDEMTIFVPTEK